MANTVFFRRVQQNAQEITWKDIFSDYRKKHSKKDFEYALLAGTSLDTATEETMINKWRKPWIFYPMLKGGIIVIAVIYALFFIAYNYAGGTSTALFLCTMIIPPVVMPLILLAFFWEMNIPRNISVYEVIGMFLLGGILSFFVTSFMYSVVPDLTPAFAAFREEPAKLAAIAILLVIFSKKNKVYGISGLVIGAAVGAGFGAFESIEYAMMSIGEGSILGMVINQIIRGVLALGGHTLYCAPYAAELALNMKYSRLSLKSFFSKDFLAAFFISCALHFLWNLDFGSSSIVIIKCVIIIVLLWAQLLRVMRKCLNQIARIGMYYKNMEMDTPIYNESFDDKEDMFSTVYKSKKIETAPEYIVITCIQGDIPGKSFRGKAGDIVTVGRDPDSSFVFPIDAKGVSRNHCSFRYSLGNWTIEDMDSSYGTFINDEGKISTGKEVVIYSGDTIRLGGRDNVIQIYFED